MIFPELNLAWFPMSIAFLTPFTCIFTYVLAIYYKTVEPIFPYISDCASVPPMSSYFNILITILTMIFICTVVLRHYQIRTLLDNEDHCQTLELTETDRNRINWWSAVSLILTFLIGASLIALSSFRVNEMFRAHEFSTLPLFLCGPFLYTIQTWISFRLQPHVNSELTSYTRLMITIIAFLSLISFFVFTVWSFFLFDKQWPEDRPKWTEDDGGYLQHVIASGSQWTYILMVSPFFATFVSEFRRLILLKTAVFIYKLDGSSLPSSQSYEQNIGK